MNNHHDSRPAYERPRVADYGTLRDLTADAGMLMPLGLSQLSGPVLQPPDTDTPGGPGGQGLAGASEGGFLGIPIPELLPTGGELGGGGAEGGGGSAPAGVEVSGGGGGGGGGGTVSTGGGDASLPFTGFPAAAAAAVGAGLAGAGAALRRALRRDKTDW